MRKKLTDYAKRSLKDSFMNPYSNPNSDKDAHATTVIRNHVLWSMGASYIVPLPIADVFAVSALQLDMIRQLCRIYGIDFAETQGKAIVTSLTTSAMTKAGARSLIKLVPGIGTIVGGVTTAILNGASTYALGEVFKKHFGNGGTFLDFDTDRLRKVYNDKFEKGKDVAQRWKQDEKEAKAEEEAQVPPQPKTIIDEEVVPAPPSEPTVAPAPSVPPAAPAVGAPAAPKEEADEAMQRLRDLAEMKKQNIITEEEFQVMKRRIIGG